MSNAPSKPVSFSRPKVGYFSNRPRIPRTCTPLNRIRNVRFARKRPNVARDVIKDLNYNSSLYAQSYLVFKIPFVSLCTQRNAHGDGVSAETVIRNNDSYLMSAEKGNVPHNILKI